MPDALEICEQRLAAIRTDEATPDTRIDQKELLRLLSPQLFEDANTFKEVFGFCRVLNVRQSSSNAGYRKSPEGDRRVEEVLRARLKK